MKVLIGAAVAALLFAGSAVAQTTTAPTLAPSRCGEAPAAPQLPDGAHATSAQMTAGNTAYDTWAHAMQTNVQCRRAEAEELRAQADARTSEYNGYAGELNQTVANWQAEVAEYNARGTQSGGRRERGGVMTGGASTRN